MIALTKSIATEVNAVIVEVMSKPLDLTKILKAYLAKCDELKVDKVLRHTYILQCSIYGFKSSDLQGQQFVDAKGNKVKMHPELSAFLQRSSGPVAQGSLDVLTLRRICTAYARITYDYLTKHPEITPTITLKYGVERTLGFIGAEGLMSTDCEAVVAAYAPIFHPNFDEYRAPRIYRIASKQLTKAQIIDILAQALGDEDHAVRAVNKCIKVNTEKRTTRVVATPVRTHGKRSRRDDDDDDMNTSV